MKIPKCSTWNKIKILLCSAVFCITSLFVPALSSFAAPAVVPVAAEGVYALLVALGLMVGNETSGYTWIGNGNSYTDSIFNTASPGFTSGTKNINDNLADAQAVLDYVMAENVYTTDGTDFFVSGKKVTASDVFLRAKSVIGVSYFMPVNISGVSQSLSFVDSDGSRVFYSVFSNTYVSRSSSIFAYYTTTDDRAFIGDLFLHFIDDSHYEYSFLTNSSSHSDPIGFTPTPYIAPAYVTSVNKIYVGPFMLISGFNPVSSVTIPNSMSSRYYDVFTDSRVSILDFYPLVNSASLLECSGLPEFSIVADTTKLDNALVQVKPNDDDDNNGSTPPAPQSPNNWEIWKSVEDLVRFIDSGELTNGGTTFDEFVNNNYNYVNVNINVPDEQNINLSGGLDINGKGDINITVHEDISLPAAGDGSGFYNPSAVNVIGALAKDNPVVSVISGLFSAIDPMLVSIFSVSVSLLLVLGLWKLIRG